MEVYLTLIAKTSTGYSAHCPDVPGCAAVGKTIEQVMSNMKEALELHFEGLMEDGDQIPKSGGVESYRTTMKDLDVEHSLFAHVQIDTSRFEPAVSQR